MNLDSWVSSNLIEDIPDAVVIVDEHGIIRYANGACETVLGFDPEELVGTAHSALIPDDVRPIHADHVAGFHEDPKPRPMGAGIELRARRSDGTTVPVKIALVPVRGHDGLVGAFVRDISVNQNLLDQIRAKDELTTALARGAPRSEWLEIGVRRAAELTNAEMSWINVASDDRTTLEVVAVSGDGAGLLLGEQIPMATSLVREEDHADPVLVGDVRTVGTPLPHLSDLDVGPVMALRLQGADGLLRGVLAVGRHHGSSPFADDETAIAADFARVLSIAFELFESQRKFRRLAMIDDHDRIARDLHDTVIQQIFGIGLRLEAAVAQQPSTADAERIHDAVESLDDAIREIRSTIFDLQSPRPRQAGLREALLDLVEDSGELLGFPLRARFGGPIDALAGSTQGQNLVTVLREALSNVVRHSEATKVEIVIDVNDSVNLTVADDGRGPTGYPTAGNGLTNLGVRAEALGGSFSLEPADGGGSVVRWQVPLPDPISSDEPDPQ